MIKIEVNGNISRSFVFPADIDEAINFFSDFEKVANFLPHIDIVQRFGVHEYRMLYQSTELGIYQIYIYCDLIVDVNREDNIIQVNPLETNKKIRPKIGMKAIKAQGTYSSKSTFYYDGLQTKINYDLDLRARLPVPYVFRLIPAAILDNIASSITGRRINEIAEGFINQSTDSYMRSRSLFA